MSFLFGDSAIRYATATIDATNNSAVNTKNSQTAVWECVSASTLTVTVEACLDSVGTNWRTVPCLFSDGGTYSTKAAGTTITLTAGDIVLVPTVGYQQVRIKRAGGDGTLTPYGHPASLDALAFLSGAALVDLGANNDVTIGTAGTDGSIALTTGGTAQNIFTPTNGFSLFNNDPAEEMWFRVGGTAAANGTGSVRLAPQAYYESPPGEKVTSAVSVIAATTGHKITGRSW